MVQLFFQGNCHAVLGQSYARYAVGTSAGSVCLEAGGVLLGPVGHRNKHQ